MDESEKKAYAAEAPARLRAQIGRKLAEIRELIAAEKDKMAECGGADAAESVLCAVDCTCDQVGCAIREWEGAGL